MTSSVAVPAAAPMGTEELWEKFEDCAKRALPRGNIAPLFDLLGNIEALGSIAEMTMLLERRGTETETAARPVDMLETTTATGWVP